MKERRPLRVGGRDGYAVLLVFAMAAAVAISLYIELPRAAFEAQRDKEQTLISPYVSPTAVLRPAWQNGIL